MDYYVLKPWRSPDEYFHRTVTGFLHALEPDEVETALLEDCHRLAGICARKFDVLRRSMWAVSLGLLLALLWLALYSGTAPGPGA